MLQCNYTVNQSILKMICSFSDVDTREPPVVFRSSFARSSRTSPICQGFRNFLSLIESSTYLIKYGYNLSKLEIGFSLWEFIEFRKSLKSVENCIVDYQSVTGHKIAMSEEESLLRRLFRFFDTQSQFICFTQQNWGETYTHSWMYKLIQIKRFHT